MNTFTTQQRHEACMQLARAAKAHLGLSRIRAAAVLQSRYNYYQTFLDGDLITLCKREGIDLLGYPMGRTAGFIFISDRKS